MKYSKQDRTHLKYIIALGMIWATIFFISLSLILKNELSEAQESFQNTHNKIYQHLTDTAKIYEVSIESFASVLAINSNNYGRYEYARLFAQQIRNHYPDIYMLEIAKRISHKERDGLKEEMRKSGYKDFEIHTFGYDTDRNTHASPQNELYYPIVFIEPELDKSKGVLGLDLLDGSSILKDALERAFNKQKHVASRPFNLMEGNRGYILYREVGNSNKDEWLELEEGRNLYALLVVDASKLIPDWAYSTDGLSLTLQYKDIDIYEDGLLVKTDTSEKTNQWGAWLLPEFSLTSLSSSPSQPFELTSNYKIRWVDLDIDAVLIFTFIAAVTFPVAFWYSLRIYRRRIIAMNKHERNSFLANYDTLTGLPNKNFAGELFKQSTAILRRSGNKLIVLYIDLNKFKRINDQYGHKAGDILLNAASDRMRSSIRDSDTLARLHGDEFVIFLTDLENPVNVDVVIENIQKSFEPPFLINGKAIKVGLSIGVSKFPDDGSSFDELLDAGDKKMYEDKESSRG